jgi:peptide deformylase
MSDLSAAVLQVGDPRLRRLARPVADPADPDFRRSAAALSSALEAFRAEMGFGRAIAAPQLGFDQRFIAANLADHPFLLINPEMTWHSQETFTLWDDCMSFPWLLVKVRRWTSISLRYQDEHGETVVREGLGRAQSELFQHELDHLDGILALDRAIDKQAMVSRRVYEADKSWFDRQVD